MDLGGRVAARWAPLEAEALLRVSIEGGPLSVAWSQPGRGEWAVGCGVAGEGLCPVEWEAGAPPGMPGPWFGGWPFDGEERWILPRVLAWWSRGRTFAAVFGEVMPGISERMIGTTTGSGSRSAWAAMISAALQEISSGALGKVVLARQIAVHAEAPFEERRILERLEARFPSCRTFLLRLPDGAAFLGATPELLCRVRGRSLETEALAGTGSGDELLSSPKDRREHALVVEAIDAALRPLCSSIDFDAEPQLKRLPNVTHLWTPIRAVLRDGVEGLDAARALHPTPAVGGTPRAAALAFQRAHEGFDRGWYAGAIGARGDDSLELAVGIRSALVRGAEATVFAGAGIVAGSTADAEWVETEEKARAMLDALGVCDG